MSGPLDPVSLTIFWNRLMASVDEAGATLMRTAFSTIVRDSNDFACTVLDPSGNSLAQNTVAAPSFVGTMPRTVRHFISRFPLEVWQEGDVVLTNDPWMGTGHLPDITMAMPIFFNGRLVAFAANVAHMPDVGGATWGADCKEVFEEGLRILPTRLYQGGQANEQLLETIATNVRVPDLTLGDMQAQVAALHIQSKRLASLLDDAGMNDLDEVATGIIGRTEGAMSAAITAVPEGEYTYNLDADGFEEPYHMALRMVIRNGRILCDYAGTSPQVPRGLNSPYTYTYAYTAYAIKCALAPAVPNNEGICRRIDVIVPDGTILNPLFPAAVGARNVTGHFVTALVLGALFEPVPGKVMAETSAPANLSVFTGYWDDGEPFAYIAVTSGGLGALANKDGLSATSYPSNGSFAPVEITENAAPLLITERSLRVNSAGTGRFRGGFGQDIGIQVLSKHPVMLSPLMDRVHHPPRGLAGGGSGAPAALLCNGVPIPSKGRTMLRQGDKLLVSCAGGGGMGSVAERDSVLVERDLKRGLITPEWLRGGSEH